MPVKIADTEQLSEEERRLRPSCRAPALESWLEAPDRFHGRQRPYLLVKCRSCSLVWQEDPPPPSEMTNHYGADYDRAIAAAGDDPGQWSDRRRTLLRYKSGGAVLDLGCSAGGFLRSLHSSSWELYGIEMSDEVARRAETSTGAKVFVGDILDAPFPEKS